MEKLEFTYYKEELDRTSEVNNKNDFNIKSYEINKIIKKENKHEYDFHVSIKECMSDLYDFFIRVSIEVKRDARIRYEQRYDISNFPNFSSDDLIHIKNIYEYRYKKTKTYDSIIKIITKINRYIIRNIIKCKKCPHVLISTCSYQLQENYALNKMLNEIKERNIIFRDNYINKRDNIEIFNYIINSKHFCYERYFQHQNWSRSRDIYSKCR